jgi:hypothetical protein
MLLEEIKGLVFFDIMETIGRRFETLTWQVVDGNDTADGMIAGIRVKLKLSPLSFHDAKGLNISFALQNEDGNFSELTGARKATEKEAAMIIGAVSNAVIDRLREYDWDFVVMIAKDNIQTRMKLYSRIANRVKTTIRTPEMFEHSGFWNGDGIVALAKKGSTHIFSKFDETVEGAK